MNSKPVVVRVAAKLIWPFDVFFDRWLSGWELRQRATLDKYGRWQKKDSPPKGIHALVYRSVWKLIVCYRQTVRVWHARLMQWLQPIKCNVCEAKAIGVFASRYGPVSWALCRECCEAGREPADFVEHMENERTQTTTSR